MRPSAGNTLVLYCMRSPGRRLQTKACPAAVGTGFARADQGANDASHNDFRPGTTPSVHRWPDAWGNPKRRLEHIMKLLTTMLTAAMIAGSATVAMAQSNSDEVNPG